MLDLSQNPLEQKPLTHNIDCDRGPLDIDGYCQNGGYQGLKNALAMEPEALATFVKDAGLRGRGGAGFPTGLKWSFIPKAATGQRYFIVNADEMEPGTFKDRYLMEGDPNMLIEGIAICAHAIQASTAFIFLRNEYILAEERLNKAINQALQKGFLGRNIMGSDFSLEIIVHTSAGRYICGEETALINALEGKRANPRAKPPFPQVSGLFGKPTVVNNVETVYNIPGILSHGQAWYKSLGKENDAGTKVFGISGRVNKPGVWELPMGTPIREIIEKHAGGMQDGFKLRGFLPGGGSTDFLTDQHLDLAMDYDVIGKAGSRMGTGTMIILDDHTCPIGMALNLVEFFAQESCGWCTPCRDGLPELGHYLRKFESGTATEKDITMLQKFPSFLAPGNTFCALAPGAVEPLQSALKYFREDFDAHIEHACCPYTSHGKEVIKAKETLVPDETLGEAY